MVSSNDVQRLFIQSILSRRILSRPLALKIWEKCVHAVTAANDELDIQFSNDRNSWDNFVTRINEALNPLNLEFLQLNDELSGKEMCILVNRKGDEIAQMATEYTPAEIAYFKAVVEQIMLAPNESYCVSSLAALKEVNSLKPNMTKTQAEVVLGSFVAKGWLVKSKRGRYSLSPRTLLELQPYLRSTYPDEILECTVCMEMVTQGIACYTPQCKTRLHQYCFTNYRKINQNCPACNCNWSTDLNNSKLKHVGEAAFREGQDQGRRRPRRQSTPESDEDAEDRETNVDLSQPSQPMQSQAKGKKKLVREDHMEVDEDQEDE
ncbi:hypothetical protein WOLCODRAFT_52070, partial [Wolfiporia cocos MD-104 SS10]